MIPASIQPRAERYHFLPDERVAASALPWIVALMVLLATLGLTVGATLIASVDALDRQLGRSFTVQIVEPDPAVKVEKVEAVRALLTAETGIGGVEILGDAELAGLLEPWLGAAISDDGTLGDDLPLPAMIDAEAADDVDLDALAERLADGIPGARLDDHADWLAPIGRLAAVLAGVALAAALLVAVATSAIIVLGVRAGLGRHGETIDVLHLIGAEDRSIAALFQYRFGVVALLGALVGTAIAVLVILIVGALIGAVGGGLIGSATLPWWGWLLVLAVPIGAVLMAMTTARVTVERSLSGTL
ncbi:MAG: cell division protein [Pseudomonadota bacterium]